MKVSRMLKTVVCLVVVLGAATVALAQTPVETVSGEAVVAAVEVTAKVTMINHETREVTLQAADGEEFSFIADEAVANLAQVKTGDLVTATYMEAIAYEVIQGDFGTGAEVTAAAEVADLGEKPAGVVGREVTVAVTITAIDRKIPTVTFKGPAGNTRTIEVMYPEKLDGVNVGDTVLVTYAEALALTVEKATKK